MIPNQFHFVFGLQRQTEPFHLVHYLCLESCKRVNQPDAIHFYYHYEPYGYYWDLIKKKLNLVQVPLVPTVSKYKYEDKYIKQFRYAHHSDFIRLEKLRQYGGIYADMDTLFVNKLPVNLFEKQFVMGREPDVFDPNTQKAAPSICNAFIMSEANAQFGKEWLKRMGTSFDGSWSKHSTLLPFQLSEHFPELIHVEPTDSFYKYPSTQAGIADLFENLKLDKEGVLSIHLWAHLWWSKLRMDFSFFHADLITEDYIRDSETTYAVLARRFLPGRAKAAERSKTSVWTIKKRFKFFLEYAVLLLKLIVKIIFFTFPRTGIQDKEGKLRLAKRELRYLVCGKR